MSKKLIIRGKEVEIPENVLTPLERGGSMIAYRYLEGLARQFGEIVPEPKLETAFPLPNGGVFLVYKCSGPTNNPERKGEVIHEIGEASPTNCTGDISADYPAKMAYKRAKSSWMANALGLAEQGIYGDIEINHGGARQNTKKPATKQEETHSNPADVIVDFGNKHKGKTLGAIYKEDPGYVKWLAEKAQDEYMRKSAQAVLDAGSKNSGGNIGGSGGHPLGTETGWPSDADLPPALDDPGF